MKRWIKRAATLLFFIGIIVLAFSLYDLPVDDYTVTFVDVGQSDCAIISGRSTNILVDAGGEKDARDVRIALDRLKVKKLDMAIISHFDSDHISGLSRIIGDYEIKKVIAPKTEKKYLPKSTGFNMLKSALKENNLSVTYVSSGDIFSFKGIKINVLSPETEYGDSNEDSAVVKIKCGEKSVLFTGDITSEVEKNLIRNDIDLTADILKVSHHGSYSVTSEEFLEAVNPSYSVVSVSKYNNYNLPNVETMKRLYGYGCEIFRTDEMGSITFKINGKDIEPFVEK
ncbi:MAG: MBL fold metallo-hydrolase [Ruminococcus sp.]|nr:MBL fold metallo-hydrolase [Ruminococcus sp.]